MTKGIKVVLVFWWDRLHEDMDTPGCRPSDQLKFLTRRGVKKIKETMLELPKIVNNV